MNAMPVRFKEDCVGHIAVWMKDLFNLDGREVVF